MPAKGQRKQQQQKKKNAGGRGRAPNLTGIKQGVGRAPAQAFGGSASTHRNALCALTNAHLPLPRAVGPYTVTKVSRVFQSGAEVTVFGTFRSWDQGPDAETWSNVIALSSNLASNPVNAPNNCVRHCLPPAGLETCTLVPSAFSVQVMNPEALQTTNGVVYTGRARTMLKWHNASNTWRDLANDFVSYTNPRLCAAAKLAMRGVILDAAPFNMSALADFRSQVTLTDGATFSWNDTSFVENEGFAPIVVYNPGGIGLQYIVTVEYRTRFPITHVATSSHKYHPPSTDAAFAAVQRTMEAEGHGARDIAASVANGRS